MKKSILFAAVCAAAFSYAFVSSSEKVGNTGDRKPEVQQSSMLHVSGKFLKDDCGETIILKGVNMGSIYDAADFGTPETTQVAQTGANAMRIVLESTYCTFPPPAFECVTHSTTSAQIQPMIQACLDNKLIPIVELHDYTGTADPTASLTAAANWWTQPDIKNVLLANRNYLILNLANEPSSSNYPPSSAEQNTYYNANVNAINILRNAGYNCPIMIDGMHFGKDHVFFVNKGAQLMAADPLHNLIFSVHTYWPSTGIYITLSDAQITSNMNAMASVNAPFVLGEIAHSENQNGNYVPINYQLLLNLCAQKNIGYFVWWWGITNANNNPLAMTTNGTINTLTPVGNVFAYSDPNALDTAIRPYKFVNGTCDPLSTQDFDEVKNKIFPVPTNGMLNFDFTEEIIAITLYDLSGRILEQEVPNSRSAEMDLNNFASALYFVKVKTAKGNMIVKKIFKN